MGAPTTPRTALRDESGRVACKWIALSVTTIGALMAALDSTLAVAAGSLPRDLMMKRSSWARTRRSGRGRCRAS